MEVLPLLVSVTGPYGVGKDTVLDLVQQSLGEAARRLTTWTTRDRRPGDLHYRFIRSEDVPRLMSGGSWLRNDQFNGTVSYLTRLDEVQEARTSAIYLHAFHASMSSLGEARKLLEKRLLAFGILPPGANEADELTILGRRLAQRGTETAEQRESRMQANRDILKFMKSNPMLPAGQNQQSLFLFDEFIVNSHSEEVAGRIVRRIESLVSGVDAQ